MPLTLTVLPVPAFLSLNAALVAVKDRLSLPSRPLKVAPAFKMAASVPSYVLPAAVMPVTPVMVALAISPVPVAVLLARV